MGSSAGVLKTAAKRIGISVDEYQQHRSAGEKWCTKCKAWLPEPQFAKDSSRGDGLKSTCRSRDARTTPGPGRAERAQRAIAGQRWCRGCSAWLPAADVARQGTCRRCAATEARERYVGTARDKIRARANARKRGLDPIPVWWREEQFTEFGDKCAYGCGRPAVSLDHIWPVRRGGRSVPANLVPACTSCNSSKKDSHPAAWVERGTAAFPEQWMSVMDLALVHNTDEWLELQS